MSYGQVSNERARSLCASLGQREPFTRGECIQELVTKGGKMRTYEGSVTYNHPSPQPNRLAKVQEPVIKLYEIVCCWRSGLVDVTKAWFSFIRVCVNISCTWSFKPEG